MPATHGYAEFRPGKTPKHNAPSLVCCLVQTADDIWTSLLRVVPEKVLLPSKCLQTQQIWWGEWMISILL